MIIRMTVYDNDFTGLIERFCTDLWYNLFFGLNSEVPKDEDSIETIFNWRLRREEIQKLLNPNVTEKLDDEGEWRIISEVLHLWRRFTSSHPSYDYLTREFKVAIQYKMEDKWENGEVVYYFTTNQKFITQ